MKIKTSINLWEESFGKPYTGDQNIVEEKINLVENNDFKSVLLKNQFSHYPSFVFIDGIMRKDASLYFEINNQAIQASLFSIAAGAVFIKDSKVNLLPDHLIAHKVERILLINNQEYLSQILLHWEQKIPNLPVRIVPIETDTSNEFQEAINRMRILEGEIVESIQNLIPPNTYVITDGNLHYPTYPFPVIGFIKSIAKPYPNETLFKQNQNLKIKENRSSIFEIAGNNIRLSWYISLADNQYVSWFNNLARLEVYQNLGLTKAAEIADCTAKFIPDFILQHISRYPQSLAPVHVLEKELGSYLGNKAMIKNLLLDGLL